MGIVIPQPVAQLLAGGAYDLDVDAAEPRGNGCLPDPRVRQIGEDAQGRHDGLLRVLLLQAASFRILMTSPGSRIGCGLVRVKIDSMAFRPISSKRSSSTPTSASRRGRPSSATKPANASLASWPG